MKNNKGFTLVELLAVITVLGILMTVATISIIKSINDSKEKAKYTAARDIVNIAEAYLSAETAQDCVDVGTLISEGYLESDVTNPKTGKNRTDNKEFENQCVVKDESSNKQNDYGDNTGEGYHFDGYVYYLTKNCSSNENTTSTE